MRVCVYVCVCVCVFVCVCKEGREEGINERTKEVRKEGRKEGSELGMGRVVWVLFTWRAHKAVARVLGCQGRVLAAGAHH